ncbi:MAG: 2-thiouracil desulfurase family protein [Gammaproteobacteria bacterium]|nr:2-thiouracil desulfurase family protein [Gammaproteobacteria bacterium]MDE0444544.1 2-thiouracil desulfurase family protein [Gammaproteobacteria bacterium]
MAPDDIRSLLAGRSIRVAASECLLGRSVRWNGGHNGDAWPRQRLEKVFTLVGICPEVGIGMGVPRNPIQLVREESALRVVAVDDPKLDYTDRLKGYASEVAGALDDVHGYIFADRSPSCGLAGVKVFAEDGSFERVGRGVYAAAILACYPDLPVVDAETLNDEGILLDFVLSVLASYGVVDGNVGFRDLVRGLLNPP